MGETVTRPLAPRPISREEVLLALYAAIDEPEDYWQALELIHELAHEDAAEVLDEGLLAQAKRLDQLIETVAAVPSKPQGGATGSTIVFDDNGRIETIDPDAAAMFDLLHAGSIWDLPLFDDDSQRLRRFMQVETTAPFVVVIPVAGARSIMARVSTDSATGLHQLEVMRLTLPARAKTVFLDSFGVTEAQFRVLESLIAGNQVDAIATELNRSVETVRSHIKALSQKLAVGGQVELVSRSLSVPVGDGMSAPQLGYSQTIADRSGDRRVQYFSLGAPDGASILYFQQVIDGPSITAQWQADLSLAGLRMISIARPGAGGTDRRKVRGVSYVAATAEAHKRVVDELGLQPQVLVCVGTGLPHALAYARRFAPQAHILALNPFPPFLEKETCAAMPGRWRSFSLVSLRAPFLVNTVRALAYKAFKTDPRKQAEKIAREELPLDVLPALRQDIVATLEGNLTLNSVHAAGQFPDEAKLITSDWLSSIKDACPDLKVTLAQGNGHFSIPRAMLTQLAQNLPNAQVQLREGPVDPLHFLETEWVCAQLRLIQDAQENVRHAARA